MDPVHSFSLAKCSGLGEAASRYSPTTSHPDICVVPNNLNFIPYAGTGVPTTKRFEVRFDADKNGVMDESYYLSILFLVDPNQEVAGVVWTIVGEPNINFDKEVTSLNPGNALTTPTKNSDGSYKLTPIPNYGAGGTVMGLTIESFWLKDHSGSAFVKNIGGEKTISYTAKAL
ncbi:MAG: hypothetical protein HQK54_07635 [Oligoflexales bacterium]|nr:hypothetical protein [Oligoflexales bacterium]